MDFAGTKKGEVGSKIERHCFLLFICKHVQDKVGVVLAILLSSFLSHTANFVPEWSRTIEQKVTVFRVPGKLKKMYVAMMTMMMRH
jgi:hypothetical protein